MLVQSVWRLLVGLSVLATGSCPALARSTVAEALPREVMRRAARSEIPNLFSATRTVQAKSLRELIQWAAPVAKDAPLRYGDFASYWAAANRTRQRSGKAFEAVLAWRANASTVKERLGTKMLVTAVEGFPTANSDLVRIGPNGEVLARFQAKLNMDLRRAYKYLTDPRYAGHTLVTTRESYEHVLAELQRKEINAVRRGIALDLKWQTVRDAIDNGRMPDTWAGKPLPSRAGLGKLAEKAAREEFADRAAAFRPSPQRLFRLAAGEQVLAKGLYIIDVATTGYLEYRDVDRYLRGEIGGGRLAVKSGIRVVQLDLAAYSLMSPEPVSKTATAVVVVVILAVDVATDVFYERSERQQEEAARKILAAIDRSERYHAVRGSILAGLAGPAEVLR